ncbi:HAD family hydrolase [Deinococcota bacterium DY0809b]
MADTVFFDVGGTLILAHPLHWLRPILDRWGVAADWSRLAEAAPPAFEFYNAHHLQARTFEEALELWRTTDRTILEGLGVEGAGEVADRLVAAWDDPTTWPLAPHAHEVLEALKARGKKLVVVSNWDGLLPRVLEVVGLAPYFDAVVVSALVGAAKPDARIFHEALARAGARPEQTLHVGDSPEADAGGAAAVGIASLLVDPVNPERDLRTVLEVA